MKKLRFAMIFLLCLGVFLCLGVAAHAEPAVIASGTCGSKGDNLTWTLYDTRELVIDGTGWMANFSEGTTPWYKNRIKISSVTIHDGVTSIGDYAFYYNINLEAISIPKTVTKIGSYAFENCANLASISIPEGVTSISWSSFSDCSSLTSVTIPEGVTNIDASAFSGCSSLTSVTIPESVTSIGGRAFSGCISLASVTIPEGITSIGGGAFAWCTNLTSITIPEGVTSIGDWTFDGCTSLVSVTIPESVTSIDYYAFNNCSALTSITIPEGVTSIGDGAFNNCTNLTSVTIPESLSRIIAAFSTCSSLTAIRITSLEAWCGIKCINNPWPSTYNLYVNDTMVRELVIPKDVTIIGDQTFSGCTSLTSVTVPESVTSIGNSAFSGCSSLTSVAISESVISIGDSAFRGCSSLTSVAIPEGVTSIAERTFYGCSSLTSVAIPEGVTSIGDGALSCCSSLTNVSIPNSVTSIGSGVFHDSSSLTSIIIPEGVTSIGSYTFSGCHDMTSVTIPENVTSIGDSSFNGCNALTDVYYGGSEEQWNRISIGVENYPLTSATIHYGLIPEIYTITYDPNGGKDAPANQQKTQKVTLTLPDLCPTRENTSNGTYSVRLNTNDGGQSVSVLRAARTTSYSFRGWNTEADGSGIGYAPGASYTADADVTLYAQWESSMETAAVTLPELARDDAIFKGWAESRDAESGIVGEYTPTRNVTLYAIWLRADLVLPASLNTIEAEAFTGGAFTYVFIPETVTQIDSRAFAFCPKLAYVQFMGTGTVIDPNAFEGVSGLTIIAPADSTAEAYAEAHGFAFMPAG